MARYRMDSPGLHQFTPRIPPSSLPAWTHCTTAAMVVVALPLDYTLNSPLRFWIPPAPMLAYMVHWTFCYCWCDAVGSLVNGRHCRPWILQRSHPLTTTALYRTHARPPYRFGARAQLPRLLLCSADWTVAHALLDSCGAHSYLPVYLPPTHLRLTRTHAIPATLQRMEVRADCFTGSTALRQRHLHTRTRSAPVYRSRCMNATCRTGQLLWIHSSCAGCLDLPRYGSGLPDCLCQLHSFGPPTTPNSYRLPVVAFSFVARFYSCFPALRTT